MLYQCIALAGLLAISTAQDDEIDIVEVDDIDSTSMPDAYQTADSIDDLLSTLGFDNTDSQFEDSFESTDANSNDDNSADDDDEDDDNDDDTDDDNDDDDDDDDDTDDDNDDGDDDDNTETSQDGENDEDDDGEDDEDDCMDLQQSDCTELESADGDQECGFNVMTGECYSIERRNGEYGSGNYDDGWQAARQTASQESSQLYTVVGILSGVIGALVLVIAGGAYYLHNKNKVYDMSYDVEREMNQITRENNDEDGEELIKTVEDVSPVVTRS